MSSSSTLPRCRRVPNTAPQVHLMPGSFGLSLLRRIVVLRDGLQSSGITGLECERQIPTKTACGVMKQAATHAVLKDPGSQRLSYHVEQGRYLF